MAKVVDPSLWNGEKKRKMCRCGEREVGIYWNINHTENLCSECYKAERKRMIELRGW